MTDTAEWRAHEPVWQRSNDDSGHPIHVVASCAGVGCDWTMPDEEDSIASFGSHLKGLDAPDYMVAYWDGWADYVEAPTGRLSRDQVARELFDYGVVMGEASKVYEELAGFSKPNTAAHHVIAYATRQFNETQADLILHDLLPLMDSDDARQAVVDYANGLHEGAYEQHLAAKEQTERFLAERAAKATAEPTAVTA